MVRISRQKIVLFRIGKLNKTIEDESQPVHGKSSARENSLVLLIMFVNKIFAKYIAT